MRNYVRSGMSGWILAVGALPAAIGAVVVLLQAGELSVPTVQQCQLAGLTSCLADLPHQRSTALLYGWIGVLLLLGVGVGLAVLAVLPSSAAAADDAGGRRQRATQASTDNDAHSDRDRSFESDRALLVRTCVELSDLVSSEALRERLTDALADVGVTPVQVHAGATFDSSRHHAVGELPTRDAKRDNRVARTERVGWVDHGRRVRYPDVVVFTADGELNHDH